MKKSLALRLAAISAFLAATSGAAMAALPAEATAAMTDMADDAKLLAGAFLVVVIVIGAIKILKRAPG